jgi:zinc ribbon protein
VVSAGPGVGVLFFGIVLSFVGGSSYAVCSSQPTISGVAPDCSGAAALLGFGILLIVVGAIVLVVTVVRRPTMIQQTPDPSIPPPVIRPVVIQQTIIKDAPGVRCPYCGTMYAANAAQCPSCGAPLP